MTISREISIPETPDFQKRGDPRVWTKMWSDILTRVRRVTNASKTDVLVDLDQPQIEALTRSIDPFDNHPDALTTAIISLTQIGTPKSIRTAICPPYELPHSPKELETETGKRLTNFDPELLSLAFHNLGNLLRSLTEEPTEVVLLSLTSLGSGDWTPLVINPTVRKNHGSDKEINECLAANTQMVKSVGLDALRHYNINLNVLSLDNVLNSTEALMHQLGITQEIMGQLKNHTDFQGTDLSKFPHQLISQAHEIIPENIRYLFYSDDFAELKQTISAGWRTFGYDAALFNFFFYLELGLTERMLPTQNSGTAINLPLEIDAYGREKETLNTFAAGWQELHTKGEKAPMHWGVPKVPVIVPRPVVSVEFNGQPIFNQAGIRQRWVR